MKKIFLIILAATLFSCKKENTLLTETSGNISYKLNGEKFDFNGEVKKVSGTPGVISTLYLIQGYDNTNSANIFILTQTDTLKEKSYHIEYGSAPVFTIGSNGYSVLDTPDYYVDVTISSYKNGYVSGIFSGKVTHIVSAEPLIVEDANLTEGKFYNLKVNYIK